MKFFERDDVMQRMKMSEYEMDRHYRHKAWQFAVENPGRAVGLAFVKLWRFWKPWPSAVPFSDWRYRCAVGCAVGLFFVPMLLLAVRGWSVCRTDVWAWGLTVGPILYFSAIHMVFVGSLRYRLPVEYPLCVLSAAGLQKLKGKRQKEKVPTAVKSV